MIKALERASVTTVPFKTHKSWNVDTAEQADLLLLEQSGSDEGMFVNEFYTSSLLALEQQSYNGFFRVLEGLHISGTFFETSSIHWSSIDNPINWEGSYKRLVYDSVDHLYYRNQGSPLTMFGLRIYKDVSYLGKREIRHINDRVLTARLPIGYYGERILPNSVHITDFSNFHEKFIITDDAHTNLILSGSNFVDVGNLSGIPNLSSSFSQSYYNPTDERFGSSVSGDGSWVVVGSPMDEDSLSFSKTGRAYLFKRTGSAYVGMQTLYSPFSQDALALEQTSSYSPDPWLIQTEFGDFLITDSSSYCALGVTSSWGQMIDGFGRSVSLQGKNLAIGSPTAIVFPVSSSFTSPSSSCVTGSGLVFCHQMDYNGSESWGRNQILSSSNNPDDEHEFGYSVCVYGTTLAVGAPGYDSGSGRVFIYTLTGSNWSLVQQIAGETTSSFGSALSLYENNLIVGNRTNVGKAWFYSNTGSAFSWIRTLAGRTDFTGSILSPGLNLVNSEDGFGQSVAVNDEFIAVGAPTDRIFTPSGSSNSYVAGVVYVYRLTELMCTTNNSRDGLIFDGVASSSSDGYFSGSIYGAMSGSFAGVLSGSLSGSFSGYYTGSFVGNLTGNLSGSFTGSYYDIDEVSYVGYPQQMQRVYSSTDTIDNTYFGKSVSLNRTRLAVGSLKPHATNVVEYTSSLYYVSNIEDELNDYDDTRFVDGFAYLYKLNSNRTEYVLEKTVRRNKERLVPYKNYGQAIHLSPQFMAVGSPVISEAFSTGSVYTDQSLLRETSNWVYDVGSTMSGSVFVYNLFDLSSEYQVGNVFYNQGTYVITTTGSEFRDILGSTGNRGFDLTYKGEHTIFEHEILIEVAPGEFNVSTNPSALVRDVRIPLDVNNDGVFDWMDVDLLLQWFNGMDADSSLSPETAMIVQALNMSRPPNVLTQEIVDYIETELYDTNVINIDGSSGIDSRDGNMILMWWLGQLTPELLASYLVESSTRRSVKEIDAYLRSITGMNIKYPSKEQAETIQSNNGLEYLPAYGIQNGEPINPAFFNYVESSSLDRTGSYLAPYITTIGLYNGLDIVAVAKLGRPVKNLIQYPMNFIVRFDFG